VETTNCIICGSEEYQHFTDIRDRLAPASGESFKLVQCKCGFIYLNPRPTEHEISQYYDSPEYDPHKTKSSTLFDRTYAIVQKIALAVKYGKISQFINSGILLDIGGGQGEFCEYMSQKGWKAELQDNNKSAMLTASDKGIKAYTSLDEIDGTKKYNLITLWHSLEHIHNTRSLFSFIRDHLSEEGLLVVAVPSHDAPERKWYGANWAPYDAPRHLYHFTPGTLQTFLGNQGYHSLTKFGLIQDTPYNILLSMPAKSLKNILCAGLILVNSMAISLMYGVTKASSVVLICKKN